jgi:ABC-2 type transport system ATP-binding protein
MTVLGFLNFAAEMRGLRGGAKTKAVQRAVEMCFLDSVLHQSVDTLSKGYRHRTCFAQSIIHDPDVLILDEPTDGLDPNQKQEVRQLIRRMGEQKAIVFSTHILEEVDAVCSRAIIIDRGRIVANGTPEELRRKSDWAGAVTLRVQGVAAAQVEEKLNRLRSAKRVAVEVARASRPGISGPTNETDGRGARASTAVAVTVFPRTAGDGDLTREVIEAMNGWQVEELRTEEGRLDEVFRRITLPDTKN